MISVIIPVGPHDDVPHALIEDLSMSAVIVQILLVHAEGRTFNASLSSAVRMVSSTPGRAQQMNSGAQVATAPFLWFLHADSVLGSNTISLLKERLEQEPNSLHYHDLGFQQDGPSLMWVNQAGVRIRSDILKMPFGDQGFCLSKAVFDQLGGYDETVDYGEDHLLVWKAHQHGIPVRRTGGKIFTSARKYRSSGWLKTTGLHLWLTARQAVPEFWCLMRGKMR